MTSPLHLLAGLTVTEAVVIHDYFQLVFGDLARLSIYNDISFIFGPMQGLAGIDQFRGKIVTAISDGAESIEFTFLDGAGFKANLRGQACRGPEALELYRPGFPLVVWN